jgi:hypothetical protein
MNIFVLDYDPSIAASYHCDKHVVKMVVEYAQILSTVVRKQLDVDFLYKPTHINHPCTIWAGQSRENYKWLCELGKYLGYTYTMRYKKIHKSSLIIEEATKYIDILTFSQEDLTPFAQAMPDIYKHADAVTAYRQYYLGDKASILKYKIDKPKFIMEHRYSNSDSSLIFLGEYQEYDLYYSDNEYPTVVARYGNHESQYISGLIFAKPDISEPLYKAKQLAIEKGLLK